MERKKRTKQVPGEKLMIRAFGLATEKICITLKLGRELDRELASTNFVAYFGLLRELTITAFETFG